MTPRLIHISIDEIQSAGASNYNALQVSLRSTSWRRVIAQVNYAWADSLDEVTQFVGALPQGRNNRMGDYGNSDFDIGHTFTGYLICDIPRWPHGPN